jgi:hypothetical protein
MIVRTREGELFVSCTHLPPLGQEMHVLGRREGAELEWGMLKHAESLVFSWEPDPCSPERISARNQRDALREERHIRKQLGMRLNANDEIAWKRVCSSPILLHARHQYAVGQGGFHVGHVWREDVVKADSISDFPPEDSFSYVYDCGSEPRKYVDRAIEELVRQRRRRSLDILVLSHFDRDHMCGIPRLLHKKKGLQVDTIMLPYVDETERLIAFCQSASASYGILAGSFFKNMSSASRFFSDMVVDPAETLSRFGPRQIIFVLDDEDQPPGVEGVRPPDPPGGRSSRWALLGLNGGFAPQTFGATERTVFVKRAVIQALDDSGCGWRLMPYVHRARGATVDYFRFAVEILLGWKRGSFVERVKDADVRRDLVTHHRSKMSRAYLHCFCNKNLTSLCLYSGPTHPEMAGAIQIRPRLVSHECAKISWIGTGDSDLRSQDAIAAFKQKFQNELPYVSTFVLPHHGSLENSDPKNFVSAADSWVVAAEPIHKNWRHPADELVKAIAELGGQLQHVRSSPDTEFNECVAVYWNHQ